MGTLKLPSVQRGMSIDQLTEIVALMRKDLEYLINGNLDVKNINADRLHVKSANIDGTIEADSVKSSWVYAGKVKAGQIDVGTLTGFTIQTAVAGKRVVMDVGGLHAYDENNIERISIRPGPSSPMYDVGALVFKDENGIDRGELYSVASRNVFGINVNKDMEIVAQNGILYISGNLNLGGAYVTGLGIDDVGGLSTALSGKTDIGTSNRRYGFNLAFDPGTRNLKMFAYDSTLLAMVNIP